MSLIVIIGNGIAGNSAASAIRNFDKDVDIVLISDEKHPLYSPCAFYKYLAEEIEHSKLFLRKLENYSDEGIRIIFGEKVSKVNVSTGEIFIGEESIHFDKMIMATGSKAFFPQLKGEIKKGSLPSRHLMTPTQSFITRQGRP